ncbi:nuclear pore complex protein [Canna indica]|uniref:50S ribosomal protein L35 n=1 Tax=Canna indica TaxID=4628 RepID=A0AAQ3JRN8_9LILI|nr:nuclear pore complex protein [Canna indica]
MEDSGDQYFHNFPQSKSVDAVRWLPAVTAFDRFIATAVYDQDAASSAAASALEIHSLTLSPSPVSSNDSEPRLHVRSSWPFPSRISALRSSSATHKHLSVVAATVAGSLHVLSVDPVEGSIDSELSIADDRSLHTGVVSAVDLLEGGRECITAGEDGKVNVVSIGEGRLDYRRVHDSHGLVSYTAARSGSPMEFATGGLGFGVQWWDQRKPGGFVAQFKCNWAQHKAPGIVHSIDIHPSRKHTCLVGGSAGTIFAWDIRYQQQPILLSGVGHDGGSLPFPDSEVWEVQYDNHVRYSSVNSAASAKVLPVMACLENGILAVLEQGEEPMLILEEPCAINAFDIDPQNPSSKLSSSAAISGAPLLLRPNPIPIPSSSSSCKPSALTIFAAKGYKMKTHKASAKRFRVTGKGKIVRRRAGKQHLLAKKNTKRKLRLSKMHPVNKSDYDNVIGALPYLKVNRNAT